MVVSHYVDLRNGHPVLSRVANALELSFQPPPQTFKLHLFTYGRDARPKSGDQKFSSST